MASTRAVTPPPRRQTVPRTPRWAGDDFAPYTSRKSARLSQLSHATPRHQSSRDFDSSSSSNSSPAKDSTRSSPQTAKKRLSRQSIPETSGRRVSGALTRDSTVSAASALGLPPPKDNAKTASQRYTATAREEGLLPTPAKTPKKRPEEITPAVKSVARNLFAIRPAPDEIMPNPKKGRKKYSGFTLDSFEAEEESAPIQIYTDSTDRVPEIDNSPDNPFYGKGKSVPAERTRSSKRRKVNVDGEGEQDIDDLEHRDDGLTYVFRGKRIFRKFTDPEPEPESETEEPAIPAGRLTRSSMKPRLLFPEKPLGKDIKAHTTEDEEADTDIEEPEDLLSPIAKEHEITDTPKAAPKFTLYTPPTTARTTRSKKVDLSGGTGDDDDMSDIPTSPMLRAATRISKSSPFEEWSRGEGSTGVSKKRATDATSGGVAKKARQ